ncbi:pyruvate kinase [Natronospira bacteriovora]|uniref:Pyruvate kinase n=1 Tax=Natronospira bacteriovora TaxID=3069753 RepID=A0ABU0W6C7_9GAMM|nr:pyruvate kinase [Natronospira sp. AB-CW4]MDQ2069556.1 pyruvate kinase [Natronospira sp. AB-CW4]
MPRRTKIVATLGPAVASLEKLRELVAAGVDVMRINFSHGKAADHGRLAALAREAAKAENRDVALLADLQGPKIRIDGFRDGPVELEDGQAFVLDAELDPRGGDQTRVGLTYKDLPRDVQPGDVLLLDDGLIALGVERVEGARIHTRVEMGGRLSDNKGINRQGGGLSAPALTDKDREDIRTAAELDVDYLAISFPRSADDVEQAKQLLRAAGGQAGMIAKIERAEAIEAIDEIILASDGVMVARGDLAVEIGDAELPAVQKMIIHRARELNRVVIVATQMMESMITQPRPTRAEVLDVANAVMDGADAVMLSAETATGKYPIRVVEAMNRVCVGAEKQPRTQRSRHRLDSRFQRIDEAIAMATMYTANHLDVRAIVALTESGSTPLWMSRIRSGIPIYALTRHESTRRRVTLYRGVYPVPYDILHHEPRRILEDAADLLIGMDAVEKGELLIFTKGDFEGVAGGTNAMKIITA